MPVTFVYVCLFVFLPKLQSIDAPTYREEEDIEPPFAVVGSNITIQKEEGKSVRGREYPWGVVDIENKVMIYSVRNPRS